MQIFMVLDLYNLVTFVDSGNGFRTETFDGESCVDFSGEPDRQETLLNGCLNSLKSHYHLQSLKINFIFESNSEIGKFLLTLLSQQHNVEVTGHKLDFCMERFLKAVADRKLDSQLDNDQILSLTKAGINFDYSNYCCEKKNNAYVLAVNSFSLLAHTLSADAGKDPDNCIPLELFVSFCSRCC